jgi:hypothetical protein
MRHVNRMLVKGTMEIFLRFSLKLLQTPFATEKVLLPVVVVLVNSRERIHGHATDWIFDSLQACRVVPMRGAGRVLR